ncbi:1-aminocyclopropane-1-carboxylate oxidase homolog 1-like [Eucalyptus grandis]|uniref:1-aminocyclopropane-1-carboxylate oxidase homolog 1-like n=1 Tax=Eucalyptus grandis TaxID=71139 RepID=UPI00192ECDEA|nr:1-aminocyclopropane-1-carboxylate oxidase homolog 1-like [Eucalyptus grandis]
MWGFFQMINHGIPDDVMDGMLEAVKQFHEQPEGVKREWYSGDDAKKFREPVFEYERHIEKLKISLSELLSEALWLDSDYLGDIEWMESKRIAGNYYPICPEPELTIGTTNRSDASFLTPRPKSPWWPPSPPPKPLVSNDKFKSVEHRVLARKAGPWVSAACFLVPGEMQKSKPDGPIKELLDENNPPMYRETTFTDYLKYYFSSGNGENGESVLPHFRISESK